MIWLFSRIVVGFDDEKWKISTKIANCRDYRLNEMRSVENIYEKSLGLSRERDKWIENWQKYLLNLLSTTMKRVMTRIFINLFHSHNHFSLFIHWQCANHTRITCSGTNRTKKNEKQPKVLRYSTKLKSKIIDEKYILVLFYFILLFICVWSCKNSCKISCKFGENSKWKNIVFIPTH